MSDGDDEIEFEFEDDDVENDDAGAEADDDIVAIENAFYEAEDDKIANPKKAIESYLRVIEIADTKLLTSAPGTSQSPINEDSASNAFDPALAPVGAWRFKAILNLVLLYVSDLNYTEAAPLYAKLLQSLSRVTRNEASDAIDAVLDAVSTRQYRAVMEEDRNSQSIDAQLEKIYDMTLGVLKDSRANQRLWVSTSIKLAKLHAARKDVAALQRSVASLKEVCGVETPLSEEVDERMDGGEEGPSDAAAQSKFGLGDNSMNSLHLFEIYALEVRLCVLTGNAPRMRIIYPRAIELTSTITDPRTVALLRESGGQMYLADKKWDQAYYEFFEAFKNYQEVASSVEAKRALKCLALSNLLSESTINPFHSQEAKVFQDDPEIASVRALRSAMDNSDFKTVRKLMCDAGSPLSQDPDIAESFSSLLRIIRLQLLQSLVAPYQSVRLKYLEEAINVSREELLFLLCEMILNGKILGRINDVTDVLVLAPPENALGKTSSASDPWGGEMAETQSSDAPSDPFTWMDEDCTFRPPFGFWSCGSALTRAKAVLMTTANERELLATQRCTKGLMRGMYKTEG